MSGWVILAFIFAAAIGALWLLRTRGSMLMLASAALLFGCAGYALQGHPGLAGSPRAAKSLEAPIPLAQIRHGFFGTFSPTEHWLIMADSFAGRGDTEVVNGHGYGRPGSRARAGRASDTRRDYRGTSRAQQAAPPATARRCSGVPHGGW